MQLAKTTLPPHYQHTNADTPEHTTTTLGPRPKVANPTRHRRARRVHLALEACKGEGGVKLLHLYEMIILVDILYLMTKLGLFYSSCLGSQSYNSINFDIFFI